jgi:hypothetical protein
VPSVDKSTIIADISPPLDQKLATQLLDEYISQEKRFILGDWEPATLDGGQFAEAAARIVCHRDSGVLNRTKSVHECLTYVEDFNNSRRHSFPDRKAALHLCRALRAIYKFRSDRGAIHIDPDYSANHLDSKYLVEGCRWVLAEILRLFWAGDRRRVSVVIQQILNFDIPSIRMFDDSFLVQRTDCSTEEEILLLLYHSREVGLNRAQLGRSVQKAPSAVTNALKRLTSSKVRQVHTLRNGNFCLTDIGVKKVLTELAAKLIL